MNYDADQLDLFVSPPPEPDQPLTSSFSMACHFCVPPRHIAVVPVEGGFVNGRAARWDAAEKWC